jgi:hypothetical protein
MRYPVDGRRPALEAGALLAQITRGVCSEDARAIEGHILGRLGSAPHRYRSLARQGPRVPRKV